MKRFLTVASAAIILAACSPQAYVMRLEMRCLSPSGLDLDNKSMAVVYLEDGSYRDSLFNNCFADGLAQGLEKEYFEGKRAVDIFSAYKGEGEDYTSKDTLQSLVMRLNKDVIFLVDTPEFSDPDALKSDCKAHVYVYDSMGALDVVKTATNVGNGTMKVTMSEEEGSMLGSDAQLLGLRMAKPFLNTWTPESHSVIYFDGMNEKWSKAVWLASEMEWEQAREIWMDLAQHKDPLYASCAQYDTALACYMMRQYDLALEWLDLSDKTQVISLSSGLRKRILEKKNK
ncbi:MAG: hypothetical protein IJ654_07625 [Bacteroidales bacterium]|nr:hypothetical protein [Bacteroidales bacterium]